MTRNNDIADRAFSLPPENSVVSSGYYLLKRNQNTKYDQSYAKNSINLSVGDKILTPNTVDLGLAEDIYPGCSDYTPSSPASVDVANGNSKHSPSDCSSAFTDEDSGCQLFYFGNALRVGPKCRIGRTCSTATLDSPSVQSFNNRDEFLAAMTEDLADWMSRLYPTIARDLDPENFFDRISNGVLLCHHATELHRLLEREVSLIVQNGERILEGISIGGVKPNLPTNPPVFQTRGFSTVSLAGSSFWARDNVANFIHWCRAMRLPDSILFETEDLVSRKNLHSVIVCLLELARLGGRVGMDVPEIIYLEKEIDNEIALGEASLCRDCETNTVDLPPDNWSGDRQELEKKMMSVAIGGEVMHTLDLLSKTPPPGKPVDNRANMAAFFREKKNRDEQEKLLRQEAIKTKQQQEEEEVKSRKPQYVRPVIDMRTLDEIVREKLSQCTCEQTFPMIRLSEGRYLFGDKSTQIFVRILRSHVMVRVGGGWDTLDHFLQKYDECRKIQHLNSPSATSKRFRFKKAQVRSMEEGAVGSSNAVFCDLQKSLENSEEPSVLMGEGTLQVTKRGREVVYTATEVVRQSPSKCNANHHCPNATDKPIESRCRDETKQHARRPDTEDALTPDITQIPMRPDVATTAQDKSANQIDSPIQMEKEQEKKAVHDRDSDSPNSCISSDVDGCPPAPLIDQAVDEFGEQVKASTIEDPKSDKIFTKPTPKPTLLPSHYKFGFNSFSPHGIKRQKAASNRNLALIGDSPGSNLGSFSKSTVSLNECSSVLPTSKALINRPSQASQLDSSKRAKSTSYLSPALAVTPQPRRQIDVSKMNVWERLSVNTLRNSTEPKIASLSTNQLKGHQQPQRNKLITEISRAPTVQRRNSFAATRKVIPSQGVPGFGRSFTAGVISKPPRVAVCTGPEKTRRSSVMRVTAEGSRIPRPAKVPTVSEVRSKSVGSSFYTKHDSPT